MAIARLEWRSIFRFLAFWLFLAAFKFGAGLHFSLMSPLGSRVLPVWEVGFVLAAAAFLQFTLDVPAGRLLDRFGYKKLMLVGTVVFVAAALFLTTNFTLVTYLFTIFLSIFGWLFFGPGASAYILSSAPKEHSGVFMSLRDISSSVGIVLSSSVLPFALLLPVWAMGWIIVLILLAATLTLSFAPRESRVLTPERAERVRHHLRKDMRVLARSMKRLNPASTMLLLLHTASGIFYGTIWFIVPLVIAKQATGNELLGIGLGIFDLAVVILGFFLGVLADKVNKRTLVFVGLLMYAVFGTLLGINFGILFLLFGFLATTGEETAGLSLWSWLHVMDKDHATDGSISGVVSMSEDFGWMVGPIIAGIGYTLVGPSWSLAIGAFPIICILAAYYLMSHKHVPHYSIVGRAHRLHRKRHKG